MLIIILFIIILNAVSILLMYRCLTEVEKKEKLIYIIVGTAVMYILTSIVYWISTKNIEITQVSELGKDLIIFLFVPINGIVILPLFAKSYTKFRNGNLSGRVLRNRGILLGILLLIILVIECIYFKNIQEQVVNMINEKNNKYYNELQQEALNMTAEQNELSDNNNSIDDTNNVDDYTNNIELNNTNDNDIVSTNEINENSTEEVSNLEENTNVVVNVLE